MNSDPSATHARLLDDWRAAGLSRRTEVLHGTDFTSNDYLDLSRDPLVMAAAQAAIEQCGAGSRGSRLLGGTQALHLEAEEVAAAWLQAERTLLFPSGYHANLALLQVLGARDDVIISDALNHASLIDGCRLAAAQTVVVPHRDLEAVEQALRRLGRARHRYVLVESVYSMDGDHAPLAELDDLCRRHDAWLVVDEAHAAGLYGTGGAGRALDLERVLARVVTGGKALGAAGAFVAGADWLIQSLLERGRSFVYTTAIAPPVAGALVKAIEIVQHDSERRTRPLQAGASLRQRLAQASVPARGEGAIVVIELGQPERATQIAARLREQGLSVGAARPPTVPAGTSRLRLLCRSAHDDATLTTAVDAIAATWASQPTPGDAVVSERSRPRPYVVIGTDTDAGKTVASAALMIAARDAGQAPRYFKPVQTGNILDTPAVATLAGLQADALLDPIISLPLPASVDQAARAAGCSVTVDETLVGIRRHLEAHPEATWILETAGGLLVPFSEEEDQADLLERLGGRHILVARSGLGTLNHTRLTIEAMQRRRLRLHALILCGPRHEANERTLSEWLHGVSIYHLPHIDPLTPEALAEASAAAHLGEVFR